MFGTRPRFGAPVEVGGRILIPVSENLVWRLPRGAFVWNRPRGVLVREGEMRRLVPVPDATRRIQWGLLAAGAAAALLIRLARRMHG
jgi:hypothetical protein